MPQKKSRPLWQRAAKWLIGGSVVAYAAVATLIYIRQEALIFRGTPLPAEHRFSLPDVAEVKIAVPNATLHALHFRLPEPRGVVFFLHGNGGNLQSWLTSTDFYRRNNFDLFMMDYRGYGKSTGQIESEEQLHADVLAAWQHIAPQYVGKKIVVYGRSLGTGLAAKLSTQVRADLTILVSPYSSLLAMGNLQYPWLPNFINRYPMRTDLWIQDLENPILITHGEKDELIPISQGQLLLKAKPAIEFHAIMDAAHNDIHKFPAYLDVLSTRLQKL